MSTKDRFMVLMLPVFTYLALSFIGMDFDWVFQKITPYTFKSLFGRCLLVLSLIAAVCILYEDKGS